MSNNEFMNENTSETKILMANALKELIKDRPFSKITVQDIVTACNINRNTFYYHFESNVDLLYFAYSQELKKVADSFHQANASVPQVMEFALDYIDQNIPLCQCAYESLGETQLKTIFEKDIFDYIRATIDYFADENKVKFSEDFKTYIGFSYTQLLSGQIIWYIKHNGEMDKEIFKKYFQTFFTATLKSVMEEAVTKGF